MIRIKVFFHSSMSLRFRRTVAPRRSQKYVPLMHVVSKRLQMMKRSDNRYPPNSTCRFTTPYMSMRLPFALQMSERGPGLRYVSYQMSRVSSRLKFGPAPASRMVRVRTRFELVVQMAAKTFLFLRDVTTTRSGSAGSSHLIHGLIRRWWVTWYGWAPS